MADATKELQYQIKVAADTAGIRLTQAETEKLATAMKKATLDAHTFAKQTGELEVSHRELKRILTDVGENAVPGLGRALGELAYGPVGAILAVGAAIEYAKKQMEAASQAAEDLRKHQAELNSSVIESQAKAFQDSAEAARKYNDLLIEINTNTNKIKEAEDERLAVLDAIFKRNKAIADQNEAMELRGAEGNPVEQARIKQKYGDAASESDLQERAAKIAEEERAKSENAKAGEAAQARLISANAALDDFKHSPESNDSAQAKIERDDALGKSKEAFANFLAETGAKTFEEAQKALAAQQAEVDTHAGEPDSVNTPSGSFITPAGIARGRLGAMNRALGDYNNKLKTYNDSNSAIIAHDDKLAGLEKAASDAEAQVKKYADAVKAATAAIDTHKKVLTIDADTSRTRSATAGAESPFGQGLLDEKSDAAKIWTGHADQVGDASKDLIERLGTLIAGHTVTLKEAARLIITAAANQESFLSALTAMNATADAMKAYSAASKQKLEETARAIQQNTRAISLLMSRSNSPAIHS